MSPGQAHDSTLAGASLDEHLPPDSFVLADKAYDAEWIRAMIKLATIRIWLRANESAA